MQYFRRDPNFKPSQQWLGGGPDLLGYVAPTAALTYYVGGSLIGGARGLAGAHPHEALAFTEGLSAPLAEGLALEARLVGEAIETVDCDIGMKNFAQNGPRIPALFMHE